MTSKKQGREGPRRSWRTPPPPRHAVGEVEGLAALRERPGPDGAAAWLLLRSASLWARTQEADRPGLFSRGAPRVHRLRADSAADPHLRAALRRLAGALARAHQDAAEQLAVACDEVANAADGLGMASTRMEFVRVGALAQPEDPRRAVEVGRLLRDLGDYSAAEGWFQRGVALARAAADWDAYARAYIGLGRLWFRRGRHPLARKHLERAARAAARHGRRKAEAMALHDLFTLEMYARRYELAMERAAAAARLYGSEREPLLRLAHDVAYQWMECGDHLNALPLLVEIRPFFERELGMVADGSIARAAGVLGQAALYRRAALAVRSAPDSYPNKAAILMEVARGAGALRSKDARKLLEQALTLADRFQESRVRILASEMLGRLGTPEAEAAGPGAVLPADANAAFARELGQLIGAAD